MKNQEIFIIFIIIVLFTMWFVNSREGFNIINDYPCKKFPLNSNCSCPIEASQKVVLGQYPLNYSEKSPYVYTCVPSTTIEPNTNIWPNQDPNEHSKYKKIEKN